MIVDNYSKHKHEKVKRWLNRHPRRKTGFAAAFSAASKS
jgi:hypothetical protein